MDDLISRQDAIDEIDEWIKAFRENGHKESAADACLIQDGIIQLPSAQQDVHDTNVGDIISRKAAIDAMAELQGRASTKAELNGISKAWKRIKQLPSAQPEIIRCKDCKHWDGVDTCDVIDAPVWDNDFCSMAERRSDE